MLFLPLACLLQVINIEMGGEEIIKHQLRKEEQVLDGKAIEVLPRSLLSLLWPC